MSLSEKIEIMYFTDMLCVWAYLEQVRIDELKSKYGLKINFNYHFIPVFGSVKSKISKDWNDRGGVKAYSEFVKGVADKFDHVKIHNNIWVANTPVSSTNCHLFLKALQLLEKSDELSENECIVDEGKTILETAVWHLRCAFFERLLDLSHAENLYLIAEKLNLPVGKIKHLIDSGVAHASLDDDSKLKQEYSVKGSPTLVFNEGRQIIYGNVGYRVVEANIEELLRNNNQSASWC